MTTVLEEEDFFTSTDPRPVVQPPKRVIGESWKPVDLKAILASGYQAPQPTIGCVDGVDHGLFYPARVNMVFGDSGGGKTWLLLYIIGQQMLQGRDAVLIDYEDHATAQVARLEQIGIPRDTILQHLVYIQPTERWSKQASEQIVAAINGRDVALAVVDSTGEALAVDGIQPNADDEVARWFRGCARLLSENGVAVVLLDHVVKSKDQLRNSDFASGSHRKRAAVNGAAYFLEVIQAPSRDHDGSFKLITRKCRFGWRKHGAVAALVTMKNRADGSDKVDFALNSVPDIGRTASGKPLFTWYMQQVSEFLEEQTSPQSKAKIVQGIRRNERLTTTAIQTLVEEGYASVENGPRGSHLVRSMKPYREPTAATPAPADIEPF